MSKYAEPWAAGLSQLKHDIEEEKVMLETGETLTTPGSLRYADGPVSAG